MTQTNPFHYSMATRVRNCYLLRFLDPQPGDRILDMGCGVGYFANLLSDAGSVVWGVDVDLSVGATARQTLDNKFLVGRGESLPFHDSSFDKVLCSEVLEHIADDARAVCEIRRVARPGATVVITVPSPDGVFGAKIKRICHSSRDDNSPEKHQRDGYTRTGLKALLEDYGIEVNEDRYSLVLVAELLMGVTKLAYSVTSGKRHLESQIEVMQVKDSRLLKAYRAVFPIFMLLARMEDILLAPWLKGHMLIVKGQVRK